MQFMRLSHVVFSASRIMGLTCLEGLILHVAYTKMQFSIAHCTVQGQDMVCSSQAGM